MEVKKLTSAYEFHDYEKTLKPAMDYRRKERLRLKLYENGNVKSVYLNEQTEVKTSLGVIPAELVTFYESGSIKRLFPRYGAISAYWSEQDEMRITEYIDISVGWRHLRCRPHNLHFYESGALKSITIYNCDSMIIPTDYGDIRTNIGVSFYETGELESIEPAFKTEIIFDGKKIRPFNFMADGMHADHNSLVFDKDGKIVAYK